MLTKHDLIRHCSLMVVAGVPGAQAALFKILEMSAN